MAYNPSLTDAFQSLSKVGLVRFEDLYTADENTLVVISCRAKAPEGKNSIRAILSSDLNFNVAATWESAVGAGSSFPGSRVLTGADKVFQSLSGHSIQQPWFGRKTWKGTAPLTFQMTIRFVAWDNPLKQVKEPMMKLLSLVYPRLSSEVGPEGTLPALSTYYIPGPSLFYPNPVTDGFDGDAVSIRVGNMIYYQACYIEAVNIRVPNIFSDQGLPLMCEATLTVTSMDVSVVKKDGTFEPFKTAIYSIGTTVDSLKDAAENFFESKGVQMLGNSKGLTGML